jgi:hypothetical protein
VRQNALVAEQALKEMGHVGLDEALELTALIAVKQPQRGRRVAVRWLRRYIEDRPQESIDNVALVAALLQALGSEGHDVALSALRDMAF